MGKKYIVGPKASYVSGGRCYKAGDEIDGGLFNEKALAAAIDGGYLIEKGQEPPVQKPAATDPGSGSGKKNPDDMTLAELKDYAAEKKIPVTGNKAEILAVIKEAGVSGGDTGGSAGGGEEGAGN